MTEELTSGESHGLRELFVEDVGGLRFVPRGVEPSYARGQGGGDVVSGLSDRHRDAVIDGIDVLHEVAVQLVV